MLIPWDFDLSFGVPSIRGNDGASNALPSGWIRRHSDFTHALAASARLRARLGARWRELRTGAFSEARIDQRLDGYQAALSPAALEENFAIWPIEEVNFDHFYPRYSFYEVASYSDELQKLRAFITARLAWMDANVDTYPGE